MERKVSDLIKEGDVLSVNCCNQEELYLFLYQELKVRNMVNDTFLDALKKREKEFPTGICCNPYNIALPHVDSEHVKTNALVLCKLENEISFYRMDKVEDVTNVKMVFMLLIKEKDEHVKALMNLTKIWRNNELMLKLLECNSKEDAIALIDAYTV